MRNLEDLKTILQEHKEELSRKYGVIEVGIFGSYVKNKQAEGSDVDILVDFREPVDLLTFVHLKNHLSDLLGINVDLVMKKALKPGIGRRILREVMYIEWCSDDVFPAQVEVGAENVLKFLLRQ